MGDDFQGEISSLRLYNGKGFLASEKLNKCRYDGNRVSDIDVEMDEDSSIGVL